MVPDSAGRTHSVSRNHDGRAGMPVYFHGLQGRRGEHELIEIEGIDSRVQRSPGFLVIILFHVAKYGCGGYRKGAVQIDRHRRYQFLPEKSAKDKKQLLCPLHGKSRNKDFFAACAAVLDCL